MMPNLRIQAIAIQRHARRIMVGLDSYEVGVIKFEGFLFWEYFDWAGKNFV